MQVDQGKQQLPCEASHRIKRQAAIGSTDCSDQMPAQITTRHEIHLKNTFFRVKKMHSVHTDYVRVIAKSEPLTLTFCILRIKWLVEKLYSNNALVRCIFALEYRTK